jgi:hypothetical protein
MVPAWMVLRTLAITGGKLLSRSMICHLANMSN